MSRETHLLFVYNADSGLFNTMADIGHKIFSPSTYECALCALTHGYFSERRQWRDFVEGLDCSCEFLHRDQFLARHPGFRSAFPVVLRAHDGKLQPCLDAAAIAPCKDLAALQAAIRHDCCE